MPLRNKTKNPFTHEIITEEVGRLLQSVSIAAFYELDVNLSEKGKGPSLWSWSSLLAGVGQVDWLMYIVCRERCCRLVGGHYSP
jgi:hypothetical protein